MRRLFREDPAMKPADEFIVLCVCRFYPRKRLALFLVPVERVVRAE